MLLPSSSVPVYISRGHEKQRIKKDDEEISGNGLPTLTLAHGLQDRDIKYTLIS